jgi:hypothetical protein
LGCCVFEGTAVAAKQDPGMVKKEEEGLAPKEEPQEESEPTAGEAAGDPDSHETAPRHHGCYCRSATQQRGAHANVRRWWDPRLVHAQLCAVVVCYMRGCIAQACCFGAIS